MKSVSSNFVDKVKSSVKKYDFALLVSWNKDEYDDRGFFTLGSSELDGGDILWSGNQDVIAFMDRYDYSNETSDCQNFKINKTISNRPWGVIQGTATVTLNNTSGRFFPGQDPYIGDYVNLPSRPIRIQVGVEGEYLNLFSGYTNQPKSTIVDRNVTLTAYDAVAYLSTKKSELSAFVNTKADEIIEALLLEAGFLSDQFVLEPSLQNPIGYCAPNGKNTLTLISDLCEAESYTIFADGDGVIQGWNANHYYIGGHDDPDWKVSFDNATDMEWSTTSILNDVSVTTKPYKAADFGKIWAIDQAGTDTLVPASGTVEIWAEPKDDNSATIYSISIQSPTYSNVSGSSYTTNTATDGSGTANNAAISLSSIYNFGDSVKMVFANSSATPTYITSLSLYGTSARQTTIEPVEVIDDDSVASYGTNPDDNNLNGDPYVIDSNYIQDSAFAINMANRLVYLYAGALAKLRLDSFAAPHLEIGDYVETKIDSLGTTKPTLIFGIETTGGVDQTFKQTFLVEEREIINYFTLDSSELDGGDVLAL